MVRAEVGPTHLVIGPREFRVVERGARFRPAALSGTGPTRGWAKPDGPARAPANGSRSPGSAVAGPGHASARSGSAAGRCRSSVNQ